MEYISIAKLPEILESKQSHRHISVQSVWGQLTPIDSDNCVVLVKIPIPNAVYLGQLKNSLHLIS